MGAHLTLAQMKSKTKRAIIGCAAVLVLLVISGAVWISMPFVTIRDLDMRYAASHFPNIQNRTSRRWTTRYRLRVKAGGWREP